jgi:type I restriction enzyme R subunit
MSLGILAERDFADDPNTALLKLRQLAELLAQLAATKGASVRMRALVQ